MAPCIDPQVVVHLTLESDRNCVPPGALRPHKDTAKRVLLFIYTEVEQNATRSPIHRSSICENSGLREWRREEDAHLVQRVFLDVADLVVVARSVAGCCLARLSSIHNGATSMAASTAEPGSRCGRSSPIQREGCWRCMFGPVASRPIRIVVLNLGDH
jgi:hypothetical protein